jgi:hypothetical protein
MHADDAIEDVPPAEVPPGEPETATEKIVHHTPWWAVSTGLHVVGALAIGLLWAVSAPEDVEAVVVQPPRKPREMPELTFPHDVQTNKPLDVQKTSAEVVWIKDATDADHTETPDDEDFKKAKGDSLDFVSDKPFKGRGTNDAIGGGGGGGGRYGQRLGGKDRLVAKGGGGPKTQDAVLEALKWLARHQNPDGSWGVTGYVRQCKTTCSPNPGHDDFDSGVTGLSLLAFLGAGYSHLSKDTFEGICFGEVVRKGLQWLMSHQDPEGCVGSRTVQKSMYNHTICALALCEAYGLTGSNLFRDNAQKSVEFLVAAQNPGKGWRYSARCGDNDSSVTGWAVMVLKSAELSALPFPRSAYDGTKAWYDYATEEAYSRTGYDRPGTGKVFIPGQNEHFDHHEALTAISVMSRIFMGARKADPYVANGCDLLLRDKPKFEGNLTDFYYWYYATLALFQFDGPEGPKWRSWNENMKTALVDHQNTSEKGCRRGSWEPVDRWSCEGGRVYGTALNALTLEVYYRYINVFVGGRDQK